MIILKLNPKGTILGDLNIKLREDILAAVARYCDLTAIADIETDERVGGILSNLLQTAVFIEKTGRIPKGVLEIYLEKLRGFP